MIFKFKTNDFRRINKWRYYMKLATKSRSIKAVDYWLKQAKIAIDGSL